MNTSIAIRSRAQLITPSPRIASPERERVNLSVIANSASEVILPFASSWMVDQKDDFLSRFNKGGIFGLIVLVHVLAIYGISRIAPEVRETISAPLEIVMLSAPESKPETALPPPQLQTPTLPTPIAPEVEIETPVNAISVSAKSEPQAQVSGNVGAPRLVSSVEYVRKPVATYPPAAKALRQRGTVMLRALIDATGHARQVDVNRSSGFRLLDDTARDAVANALFKPYMENGQAIPVYVLIPIEFGAAS